MTVVQFSILRNVARMEPVSLMQLARLLVMERTTLYRDLKPMERQGWLVIEQGNGRSKTASLTSAGRNAMLGATSAWEATQQQLLRRIGMEEWENFQSALGRIVDAAQDAAA